MSTSTSSSIMCETLSRFTVGPSGCPNSPKALLDTIKDFNLLTDKLFIGGFDGDLTDESLAIMSGDEMFGEGWQDLGDSLYKDYVVGIEKLTGDFDAILYLEDVNYSTEEVNLLLKDILTDVAA